MAIERKDTTLKLCILIAAAAMLLEIHGPVAAAEFPYDQDLLLDVRPLPGSKRVPILEIGPDGRAQVDLWCRSGRAQVTISGEAITFTPVRCARKVARPSARRATRR